MCGGVPLGRRRQGTSPSPALDEVSLVLHSVDTRGQPRLELGRQQGQWGWRTLFHSCLCTACSLCEPALLSNLTAEWANREKEATPKTEHSDFHHLHLTVYNYDGRPSPRLPHCPTSPRAEAKVQEI